MNCQAWVYESANHVPPKVGDSIDGGTIKELIVTREYGVTDAGEVIKPVEYLIYY